MTVANMKKEGFHRAFIGTALALCVALPVIGDLASYEQNARKAYRETADETVRNFQSQNCRRNAKPYDGIKEVSDTFGLMDEVVTLQGNASLADGKIFVEVSIPGRSDASVITLFSGTGCGAVATLGK